VNIKSTHVTTSGGNNSSFNLSIRKQIFPSIFRKQFPKIFANSNSNMNEMKYYSGIGHPSCLNCKKHFLCLQNAGNYRVKYGI
jgi:hypothetical protein